MMTGGKAASVPAVRLWLSPSEFAAELATRGLSLSEKAVRERCHLPEGNPLRIARHPQFPGRIYIARSELDRLTETPGASA